MTPVRMYIVCKNKIDSILSEKSYSILIVTKELEVPLGIRVLIEFTFNGNESSLGELTFSKSDKGIKRLYLLKL